MKNRMRLILLIGILITGTVQAEDGLVAYWPFDTDFTNAEGTPDYDGIPAGKAEISSEDVRVGTGALKIDDDTTTSSHVTTLGDFVGDTPVVNTVVGWYKYMDISGDGSDERNFIWETQPTYSLSFGIRGSGSKYSQWYFDADNGAINGTGPTVSDGLWHHAAVVWNTKKKTIKYYHDGELYDTVETASDNNPLVDQEGFNIGTHRSADGSRNWDGYLDDIAIFNVELTADQIAALYKESATINPLNVRTEVPNMELELLGPDRVYPDQDIVLTWDDSLVGDWTYSVSIGTEADALSPLATDINETECAFMPTDANITTYTWQVVATSPIFGTVVSELGTLVIYENQGLVAYWPFDEDFTNAQGNSQYDGIKVETSDCVNISAEEVRFGTGALELNDNDVDNHGLVQIDPSPFFPGQRTLTLTGWYFYKDISNDGSQDRPYVFETAPNYAISYGTQIEDGGLDTGEWYLLGTPQGRDLSGPIDEDPRSWYHVALVYDAKQGTMAFYYNGELRDRVQGVAYEETGDGLADHDVLNIGDYREADGSRMFDGYIDDVAAFDVALNAEQVKALYDGTYNDQDVTPMNVLDRVGDYYATSLYPAGKQIPQDCNLAWKAPAGLTDVSYVVYFSTDEEDVLDQAYATTTETQLDVDLDLGTTYTWRVDVVANNVTYVGQPQEFTTSKGLVAYYTFDENLWTYNDDYEYDGQAIGKPVVSEEDVKVGSGALKIDDDGASANLVTIETSPYSLDQKVLTVTGWYKFKDISGDGYDSRPFVMESDNYNISYGTRVEEVNGVTLLDNGEWYLRGTPGWSDTSGPVIALDDDQWHHFALVYNANEGYAKYYYDGELQDFVESDPGYGLSETTYINLGDYRSGNGGRNFDGYLDDFAFFDIALNADQIKALHDSPETINGGNILDQNL